MNLHPSRADYARSTSTEFRFPVTEYLRSVRRTEFIPLPCLSLGKTG